MGAWWLVLAVSVVCGIVRGAVLVVRDWSRHRAVERYLRHATPGTVLRERCPDGSIIELTVPRGTSANAEQS